jgi:hypothetical protein
MGNTQMTVDLLDVYFTPIPTTKFISTKLKKTMLIPICGVIANQIFKKLMNK